MKVNFRKNYYVSSIVFIGISLALTMFIIFPLIRKIEESCSRLITGRQERAFFSEEKENLQNLKPVFQDLEPDLEKIDSLFINSEVPIEFINFLERLAIELNVFVDVHSVSSIYKQENAWSFLVFKLDTSSSFINLSKFIEKLKNSSYLVEVKDLNMRKMGGYGGASEGLNSEISASFSIKVFAK